MKRKTLLLLPCLFIFSGCEPWIGSNVTKAILAEASTIVFNAAVDSFTSDFKVDLGHSMAKGIWEQGSVAINSGAIKRIADAWSADRLHKLSAATLTAYDLASPKTDKEKLQVANVIASSINKATQAK